MSDNYIYDGLLSIEKGIERLCNLVEQQNKIALSNNQLLRKLALHQDLSDYIASSLDCEPKEYLNKNVYFLHPSMNKCYEYAKEIARLSNCKIVVYSGYNKGELSAVTTALNDNDMLFIDTTNPCFDEEMYELLKESVLTNCYEIKIGQGPDARKVQIDIPHLNYLLYYDIEDFVPIDIQTVFMKVK